MARIIFKQEYGIITSFHHQGAEQKKRNKKLAQNLKLTKCVQYLKGMQVLVLSYLARFFTFFVGETMSGHRARKLNAASSLMMRPEYSKLQD